MSIQLEFRDIEYIHAIDKWKSVTAAAAALNITQPALSIYINRMEERFGVPIFNRVGKSFILTYAGQCLLEDGLQILLLKKNIEERLSIIHDDLDGKILVGVPVMRGSSFLPVVLKEFRSCYPNIKIELTESGYGMDLEEKLLSGEIDIAFYNVVEPHPAIDYTLIRRETVALFASKDMPCVKNAISRPGFPYPWIDLNCCRPYPFLQSIPKQITARLCEMVFQDYDFTPTTQILVRNQLTAIGLANMGYGLFIAPDYFAVISDLCWGPPLVLSIGKNEPYYIDFVAATRKKFHRSPPIRKLLEITTEFLNVGEKRRFQT